MDPNFGHVYYFHRASGRSQWEWPGEQPQQNSSDGALAFFEERGRGEEEVGADEGASSLVASSAGFQPTYGARHIPTGVVVCMPTSSPKPPASRGTLARFQEYGLRQVVWVGRQLGTTPAPAAGAQSPGARSPKVPQAKKSPGTLQNGGSGAGKIKRPSDGDASTISTPYSGDFSCGSPLGSLGPDNGGGRGHGGAGACATTQAEELLPGPVEGFLVRQPQDGSCLFHSIAYGLGDGTRAERLRQEIAAFIGQRPSLLIANTTIKEWVRLTAGTTPLAYTKELEKESTWGGALEMAVAAQIRNVHIDVYERCEDKYKRITRFSNPSATRAVNVVYRTKPCRHYDALCLREDA